MSEKPRPQWLLAAGMGLLIAVLVVVALIREPIQLDPTTPEGTVQEYLEAISEDNYDRALEILDQDEFAECVAADIARYAPMEPFTANLEGEAGSGTLDPDARVTVSVRIRFGTEGLFRSSWETWETFELESQDGFWWITGDPWPHFVWECHERGDF